MNENSMEYISLVCGKSTMRFTALGRKTEKKGILTVVVYWRVGFASGPCPKPLSVNHSPYRQPLRDAMFRMKERRGAGGGVLLGEARVFVAESGETRDSGFGWKGIDVSDFRRGRS
jgi:hypothetical protein